VGGDVEVSDPIGSDFQKEHVENSKGSGHHDEEVANPKESWARQQFASHSSARTFLIRSSGLSPVPVSDIN
jgi:hypothetical protein